MWYFLNAISNILSIGKIKFLLIALGFIFVSVLEAFGIGLIGPFIYFVSDPSAIQRQPYLNRIYQQLNLSSPNDFLLWLGIGIIVFFAFKSMMNWRVQSFIYKFSFTQEAKLAKKLMRLYLKAPYTYHLSKDSSYIINTILSDVKALSLGVFVPSLTILANISVITSLSLLLLISDPLVTAVAILFILPIFLVLNTFRSRIRSWGSEISNSNRNSAKIIYESLGGIKEVKAIGCEQYFNDQLSAQCNRYVKASSDNFSFKILPRMVLEAAFVALLVGITLLVLFVRGDASSMIATLGTFALVAVRLIPASSNLASSLINVRSKGYVVDKLYADLQELERAAHSNRETTTEKDPRTFGLSFTESIQLSHISYSYPGSYQEALSDISIQIKKGQSVAFIGKSGAGKTTLVDVLLGILTPSSGDILIDGVSIYNNLADWRQLIGYMPQSVHLIDDSLVKNIALGVSDKAIDYEKIHHCIRSAQLEDVVKNLPEGIYAELGERGVRLSGGQRQRVGIARALYHGSDILIMDEATSALDSETEALITESIKSLSRERTVIVIAHRMSTIQHCDQVFLLNNGQLTQTGSYEEVVASRGL
ncbi:ABC transporter, ATP-binding protein [Synechococcus sp. PCC 7335]|uniref:ABC transporter ATP-binding protein n=1 Tax=Synechococcus sp. (strain ATCC 29403 / PCC 7335) TaxID=91464 RepID=UPI00017ED996|nr:ABC transporter ATP-binding protein [Synechococcus sp. PCC 7335]EDX84083.1 ABC transporter, ATP-binding protein [Synechococcus sp. PCC 7335]